MSLEIMWRKMMWPYDDIEDEDDINEDTPDLIDGGGTAVEVRINE